MVARSKRGRLLALGFALALSVAWGWATWRTRRPVVTLRRAPGALERLDPERAKYASAWNPDQAPVGRRHLPRFPVPESVARRLFPIHDVEQPYDELTYLRHIPDRNEILACPDPARGSFTMRTNSLGLREDAEPSAEKPDLRILVTGDSHSDGVCENAQSFANVLESELARAHPGKAIEALNASKGSFTFYSYLGTLEKFLRLEPDVFVVAVYAPNDFEEVLTPYHWFEGTPRPPGATRYWPLIQKALAVKLTWLAQEGLSLKYFQQNPQEIAVATRAARQALLDMQELCRDRSIDLVVVVLPSLFDTVRARGTSDPEMEGLMRDLHAALELAPGDIGLHDRMADELLAFLTEREIPYVDGRAVFAGKPGPFFWKEDFHLNVDGHRAIGQALAPIIERVAANRLR